MYQNLYPYNYHNSLNEFRVFEVGQFYDTQRDMKWEITPTGQTPFLLVIPAGTRFFVHRVDHEEGHIMVTGIFSFQDSNGRCTIKSLRMPTDMLSTSGAG
ncbi:hypothetical protein ACFWDG_20640 [Peribacillus sp. NPDC060186]